MVRIALLDDYQNVGLSKGDWSSIPDAEVQSFQDHIDDEDALVQRLAPFEIIVAMRERTPFPRSLVERLPEPQVSRDHRRPQRLLRHGGSQGAQHRRQRHARQPDLDGGAGVGPDHRSHAPHRRRGPQHPRRTLADDDRAHRCHGKTLACLGLGNLGSQVARVGKAFGMDVIAWSQNLTQERCDELGARLVTKDELFQQADVLTVHLVLSDRSRGLVGERELAMMKPTAYLVNTSRGPIVDEGALIRAVQEERIAGAGIDVYSVEPLPADHPYRSLKNTLLTTHIGYVTSDGYGSMYGDAVEDIKAFLAGSPVRVVQ